MIVQISKKLVDCQKKTSSGKIKFTNCSVFSSMISRICFIFVNLKKDTILVLYSQYDWMPAMLVNSAGEKNKMKCFEPDSKTEAYDSCSVNWNNQLFIFGGRNEKRQISQLNGHKLVRVGSLTFDFTLGACSVMAKKIIFLCFSETKTVWQEYNGSSRCRRSSGPLKQFSEITTSKYPHDSIQTSSSDSKL